MPPTRSQEAIVQSPSRVSRDGKEAVDVQNGVRKAAILMAEVGDEVAAGLLQNLGEHSARKIKREMEKLGQVSLYEREHVLTEFREMLASSDSATPTRNQTSIPTDANGWLETKMWNGAKAGYAADLQRKEPKELGNLLRDEHAQTVALVLAHLDAGRGSAVLMQFGAELRSDVVRRMAEMRPCSSEVAQKVILALTRSMNTPPVASRKSYAGYGAAAELLKQFEPETRDGILKSIEHNQPEIAACIRTAMFTFDDLVALPQAELSEVVRQADRTVLARAMQGAKENVRAHLYRAMSHEAVHKLKAETAALRSVQTDDVRAAQEQLVALANRLEVEGKMVSLRGTGCHGVL